MSQLPTLYSRTSTGAIQQWQIVVEGDKFYTIEGLKDGKMTTSLPTICEGKNIGKKNETLGNDQAIKEAKSKWKKKIDSGYHEDIKDIDEETFYEPMLAHKYGEHEFSFPCVTQPKLDGMRCICRKDGMWSRNGKKILSAPHIRKALEPLFENNPNLIFDGELYCDKLKDDFNKIMSLVKKTKPTDEDLKESSDVIQYWIYDLPSSGKNGFKQRCLELRGLLSSSATPAWLVEVPSCLVCVDTTFVNNQNQLDDLYGKYLDHGFEGQMIRTENGLYENKRSKNLLKRKEFIDSEYEVVDVVEGVGGRTGTAGNLVLKLGDGRTFKSNIKGSFDYLKQLLIDRKQLIGKMVTVKYFQLTPDGIPRFPFMTSVRDYE
jgi:DNA ligase-1